MKRLGGLLLILLALAVPALGGWESLPEMSAARIDPMVAVDESGVVYVTGGSDYAAYLRSAERLAPGGEWQTMTEMPFALTQGSAAYFQGQIYIAGGYDGEAFVDTMLKYDTSHDQWNDEGQAPASRYGYTLDVLEGMLYLAGGADAADVSQADCWKYDPETKGWTGIDALDQARRYHGSAVVDGKLYIFGGVDDSTPTPAFLNAMEMYDPASGEWKSLPAMPITFWGGSAGAVDGEIWACHGTQNGEVSAACYRFDINDQEWQAGEAAETARYHLGSSSAPLYAVGGISYQPFDPLPTTAVECLGLSPADDDVADDDATDDDAADDDVADDDVADDDVADDDIVGDDDLSDDDDDDDDNGCGCG